MKWDYLWIVCAGFVTAQTCRDVAIYVTTGQSYSPAWLGLRVLLVAYIVGCFAAALIG